MGTYRKPQSTDLETGTGASVRAISPAQAALEATRGFTKTFGDRVKAVTDFENQAAELGLLNMFNRVYTEALDKRDWISKSIDLCNAYMKEPTFDTQKYANSTDYMIDLLTTSAQPVTASTGNALP